MTSVAAQRAKISRRRRVASTPKSKGAGEWTLGPVLSAPLAAFATGTFGSHNRTRAEAIIANRLAQLVALGLDRGFIFEAAQEKLALCLTVRTNQRDDILLANLIWIRFLGRFPNPSEIDEKLRSASSAGHMFHHGRSSLNRTVMARRDMLEATASSICLPNPKSWQLLCQGWRKSDRFAGRRLGAGGGLPRLQLLDDVRQSFNFFLQPADLIALFGDLSHERIDIGGGDFAGVHLHP